MESTRSSASMRTRRTAAVFMGDPFAGRSLAVIGSTLGRYEILEELGRGGQSIAYKARDPKINRIVAIKQILSSKGEPPKERLDFLTRFMREAQSAGRLSHPNIATIYDFGGDEEGEPYIAMEYVEGCNLEELIANEHPLPQDRILRIFIQLCGALEYAHNAGIVHRDIKPGNIMISCDDSVKVVDFGIAKMDSANLTQAGMVMGTPNYMSPEQIMGKPVDRRSDIFSLGVVLYESLTGEKPFVGEHWTTVSFKIVNERHGSVLARKREPNLLPDFERIVDQVMAKNPASRFQTCAELGLALEPLLQHRSLTPTPVSGVHVRPLPPPATVHVSVAPPSTPKPDSEARTAVTATPPKPERLVASALSFVASGESMTEAPGPMMSLPGTDEAGHPEPIDAAPPEHYSFTISKVSSYQPSRSPDRPPPTPRRPPAGSGSESDQLAEKANMAHSTQDGTKSPASATGDPDSTDAPPARDTGAATASPHGMKESFADFRRRAAAAKRRSSVLLLSAAVALIVALAVVAMSRIPSREPALMVSGVAVPPAPMTATTPSAVAQPLEDARSAMEQGLVVGRDGKDALHFARVALALDPANADALQLETDIRARALEQVDTLRERRKTSEVLAAYELLLEEFPGDAEIQSKLDAAQSTLSRLQVAAESDRLRKAGDKAFNAGNFVEAVRQFSNLARLEPRNASAFYFLGRSNVAENDLSRAARNLTRACELEPRNPTYNIQLGRVWETSKNPTKALVYFEKGIELGGDSENSPASLKAHTDDLTFRIELAQLTPLTMTSKHLHILFRCSGNLVATETGISYVPDEQKEHAMRASWEDVQRIAIVGERLEIKLKSEKSYSFEPSDLGLLTKIAASFSNRH